MNGILFEKVKIARLELPNRFLMSAAASWKATEDGDIADGQSIIHYKIAGGGVSLLINGGVGVHKSGRRSATSALFDTDERIHSFQQFAKKIHEGGAAAAFQLTHSGLWAGEYQKKTGGTPFAPSFIIQDSLCKYFSPHRENCPATKEQIHTVISAYGDAAERAKRAGYDAVEVHAAHESLLSQFLSPITNIRKDDRGGNVENRCRIHREILWDIKKKVGKDFPVIMKLGVCDQLEGGLTLEDGIEAAKLIAGTGNVDALEISQGLAGSAEDYSVMSIRTGINSIEKEAYYREWTNKAKKKAGDKTLIIMQGGLRTPELMEEIVKNGEADLVSMCRPYIMEPGLINRWKNGDRKKAACISCNKCAEALYFKGEAMKCQVRDEKQGVRGEN